MKKSILFIFALMAAMSLSCKKEALTDGSGSENSGNTTGEYAYTIKGTFASEDDAAAGDSKVGIGTKDGNYFGKWEAGDQVVIYEVVQAQNSRTRITEEPIVVSNISEDGKSADIRFNIRENVSLQPPTPSGQTTPPDKVPLNANTKCRAFYYSDALVDTYGQGILAAEQVQKGTGLENTSLKKYAFIYTTSDASVNNKVNNPSDYCKFYHALSYVDISFNSTDFDGWKVDKIVMKKDSDGTALAGGTYNINCSVAPAPIASRASAMTARGANVKKEISLTFENPVTLSKDSQSAWMVAFPTYISNESDGFIKDDHEPVPQYHYVYFQLSKDGRTEYAKVRFKTCLKGGCVKKLKVGAITKTDIMNDYKDIYDEGFDIKIGDMVVNKTTFPTAFVKTPSEINSEQTNALSKGIVFIDDNAGSEIELTAANPSIAKDGELIVVGRYANLGKQVNIKCKSLRNINNVSFLNVKFTCTGGDSLFERNSTQTTRNDLRLVDCYIDVNTTCPAGAVIKDRGHNTETLKIAAPFSGILVDNCVVKMGLYNSKPKPFYYLNRPLAEEEPTTTRTLEIKNSTIFYPTATVDGRVIDVYEVADGKDGTPGTHTPDKDLDIKLTSNTFVNFVSGSMNRVYVVKGLVSDKDLVYASGMTSYPGWNTPKYHWGLDTSVYTGNKVGTCSNCYFAWDDMWYIKDKEGKINECQKWATYAVTNTDNINKKDEGTPFTDTDYDLGYFPVNRTKVTNGAGASYDTKGYCEWTATTE